MKFGGIWRPASSTESLDAKRWYLKLMPHNGDSVALVACKADGSRMGCGYLLSIDVSEGLTLHTGINSELGLKLSREGRLLRAHEVKAGEDTKEPEDEEDDDE